MKRAIIAVFLLLAAWLSTGCNTNLPDGTVRMAHIEDASGQKDFDETHLPDSTVKIARIEFPNGEKRFDVTNLPDNTEKVGRVELPNGTKQFNLTFVREKHGRQIPAQLYAALGEPDENGSGTVPAQATNFNPGKTTTCEELLEAAHQHGLSKAVWDALEQMSEKHRISAEDAATLRSSNEPARLRAARHLGWNTIPSNDFTLKRENGQILVEGTGQGHGIGLCQSGAKAMAADGSDFRQILSHYYPNTDIVSIHTVADSLATLDR